MSFSPSLMLLWVLSAMVKCHHSLSNTLLVETSACLTYLPNCPSPTHSNCWLGTYHLGTLVHPFHLAVDQTVVGQVIPLTHRAYIVPVCLPTHFLTSVRWLGDLVWSVLFLIPPFNANFPWATWSRVSFRTKAQASERSCLASLNVQFTAQMTTSFPTHQLVPEITWA